MRNILNAPDEHVDEIIVILAEGFDQKCIAARDEMAFDYLGNFLESLHHFRIFISL